MVYFHFPGAQEKTLLGRGKSDHAAHVNVLISPRQRADLPFVPLTDINAKKTTNIMYYSSAKKNIGTALTEAGLAHASPCSEQLESSLPSPTKN